MSGSGDRSACVGAIDIGGTKVALGLVSDDGRVEARAVLATASLRAGGAGPELAIAELAALAEREGRRVVGVGVGATGRPRGTVLAGLEELLPAWDGQDVRAIVAARLGVDCAVENDADAVALAEHRQGSAAGADPLAYVTVSTGIGIGVVLGGAVVRGRDGAHPEFGHHVIGRDGPRCRCGATCLERRASGRAVEEAWFERTGRREDAGAVVRAADAGNAVAEEVLARAFDDLAVGLANLASAFAPEVIVVGGGLGSAFGRIGQALDAELATRRLVEAPSVLPTSFGPDAGIVGAATVWWVAR